jgi:hypothetical protein
VKRVKGVATNISYRETLDQENGHQSFLDFVNLLPLKAGNPEVQMEATPHVLGKWSKVFSNAPQGGTFEAFLDRHFPVKDFPQFRKYLAEGDPRFSLPTPVERWKWITSLNLSLRTWAGAHDIDDGELSPWAMNSGWKPEGICCVCGILFPRTRKDRKTCSEKCGTVHRQREWQKRKESGSTKRYGRARKLKQFKGGK